MCATALSGVCCHGHSSIANTPSWRAAVGETTGPPAATRHTSGRLYILDKTDDGVQSKSRRRTRVRKLPGPTRSTQLPSHHITSARVHSAANNHTIQHDSTSKETMVTCIQSQLTTATPRAAQPQNLWDVSPPFRSRGQWKSYWETFILALLSNELVTVAAAVHSSDNTFTVPILIRMGLLRVKFLCLRADPLSNEFTEEAT